MKPCRQCGRVLPVTDFAFRSRAKGIRHTSCRDCRRTYNREHYRANREQYGAYRYNNQMRYRAQNRQQIQEYLAGRACIDCGESDPIVLEFDHVCGEKTGNISEMVNGGLSWRRIYEEIQKCEIRCANCHRRKTVRQLKWFKGNFGA